MDGRLADRPARTSWIGSPVDRDRGPSSPDRDFSQPREIADVEHLAAGLRISFLTLVTSFWWMAGLITQGGYGIPILRYDIAVAPATPFGRGILADVPVTSTIADLLAGRDKELATALELARTPQK